MRNSVLLCVTGAVLIGIAAAWDVRQTDLACIAVDDAAVWAGTRDGAVKRFDKRTRKWEICGMRGRPVFSDGELLWIAKESSLDQFPSGQVYPWSLRENRPLPWEFPGDIPPAVRSGKALWNLISYDTVNREIWLVGSGTVGSLRWPNGGEAAYRYTRAAGWKKYPLRQFRSLSPRDEEFFSRFYNLNFAFAERAWMPQESTFLKAGKFGKESGCLVAWYDRAADRIAYLPLAAAERSVADGEDRGAFRTRAFDGPYAWWCCSGDRLLRYEFGRCVAEYRSLSPVEQLRQAPNRAITRAVRRIMDLFLYLTGASA